MTRPRREELSAFADLVKRLRYRYRTSDKKNNEEYEGWSFTYIPDLRPREDKEGCGTTIIP